MPSLNVTRIFNLLKNPERARVLVRLNDGEACAKTLAEAADVKQPALSKHLRLLRQAGLVTVRVDGKFRRFSVNKEVADPYLRLLMSREAA